MAPLLVGDGAAGMAWSRLRGSPLAATASAEKLRNAYRGQALQQRLDEVAITRTITDLRSAGVEAIVLKGWAVARLYPEPALRPYGDLDLCIPPQQLETAREVLKQSQGGVRVDLEHGDLPHMGCSVEELFSRSRRVLLGQTEVRVLAPEDQLRLLCLHFLRHNGKRPVWLVDIAAALENRPPDFDWNLCLGPDPVRADYIACAIGIAHQLLGASVEGTPVSERAGRLPSWLTPAVLDSWVRQPFREFVTADLVRSTLRHPWTVPRELAERWPGPVNATVGVHGPFNEMPRFPFQLAAYLRGVGRVLRRLPSLVMGN